MKLGMPQLYEFDTIEENLILAKQLNLDFIELNLNFGYCRKEMEEGKLFDLLKKYDIEATLHFYDEADFGLYDEVVNAYLSLLKKYSKLGKGYIKMINVHNNPGPIVTISGIKNYIYDKEYNEYINRLISNLKKAEEICLENDIKLVIEGLDDTYVTKTTYLEEVGSFTKLTHVVAEDSTLIDEVNNLINAMTWKTLPEVSE